MFLKRVEDGFAVTAGPSSPLTRVSLIDFSFVSAIRWNPHRSELLLTGTAVGNAGPNLSTNSRGDLRLYRFHVDGSSWAEVYGKYAHDPVYSPEFGYAVHRGNGITFVDDNGVVGREVKVGRFNWGCPALSVSRDGRSLAWVRWKGDDMKPRVESTDGDTVEFRSSVARYCWFSDDTLLARNGGLPFLLDLASGKTTPFAKNIRSDLVEVPSTPDHLRDLLSLKNSQVWQWSGDLARSDDRAYFSLSVTEQRSGGPRFDGLVSVNLDGRDAKVHAALGPSDRIESFSVQPETVALSIATYKDLTIVDRRVEHLGPHVDFMNDGWVPLLTSADPSFGSHAPLGTA